METQAVRGKTGFSALSNASRFVLPVRRVDRTRRWSSWRYQQLHGELLIGLPLFSTLLLTRPTKKNAQAPLSSLYDHNSPLEQLHYTLLLHILRRQGFGFLLDNVHSAPHFRKLLAETVLATDMRVHSQFMERFRQIVNGAEVDHWTKRVLVCQALIKAADISNPVIKFSFCIDYLPRLTDHPVSPYRCLTTLGICPPGRVDVTSHPRATSSHDPIGKGRS